MTTVLTAAQQAKERLPRNVLATKPTDLATLVATLSALSAAELAAHIDRVLDDVEGTAGQLRALLPEPGRRARLQAEATALFQQYPDATARPPLFGALLGVKDILCSAGLPTRCGSALPPEVFADMVENSAVSRCKAAGALVLGKTVTTEFASSEPGATTNPWDPNHTPGGSSQVR